MICADCECYVLEVMRPVYACSVLCVRVCDCSALGMSALHNKSSVVCCVNDVSCVKFLVLYIVASFSLDTQGK